MAGLTYQKKSKLNTAVRVVLIVLAAIALLAVLRFVYLGRFLVYDEHGVHFDRSGSSLAAQEQAQETPSGEFKLISETPKEEIAAEPETPKISGLYLTAEQLMDEDVRAALDPLPENCNTVMLDMKTLTGKALYPSTLCDTVKADTDAIESFVQGISLKSSASPVARIPAYRDSAFALSDYSNALAIRGGALWMDANGSYCLDPAKDAVREYLIATAEELSALGFREIVFDGFDFPQSTYIVYPGDGQQAAREAAAVIAEALAEKNISVSFGSTDPEIMALSAHAWIETSGGELVSSLVRDYGAYLPEGEKTLVFLTSSKDTRFADYGVLSPPETE
ncbi:MAG: hypothetical protein IJT18_00295 [Oscillospiraceae bacterium]|nr:hypothetical protein [Oscillospiraceae bacterium]